MTLQIVILAPMVGLGEKIRCLQQMYAEQSAKTSSVLDRIPDLCKIYATIRTKALVDVVRQQQVQI